MTFNNDLITETIKIYLGSGLRRCVCGQLGLPIRLSPLFPPPMALGLFCSALISCFIGARAMEFLNNFALFAGTSEGRGWAKAGVRVRAVSERGGPHVRKKNEYTKKTQNWRPAAKQNERCKKGEGEGETDSQEGLLDYFSTYLSSARFDNKISCSRSRSHAAAERCYMCVAAAVTLFLSLSLERRILSHSLSLSVPTSWQLQLVADWQI